jgi:plastocyanin
MKKTSEILMIAVAIAALGSAVRPQRSGAQEMKMNMPMANPAKPAAAPGTAQDMTAKPEVSIKNYAFSPDTLTVAVGTTVTWTNRDDDVHTVTSDQKENKPFASKNLDTGEVFSFKFTKPGTYGYLCAIHPMMVGKVIVR